MKRRQGLDRSPLRAVRAAREPKVTQLQLARKVHALLAPIGRTMSAARIWQIENGEGAPAHTYEKSAIATALDVPETRIDWPDVAQRVSA